MFEAKLKIHDNKNINNYLVIALITSQCSDKCHICLIKIFRKYKNVVYRLWFLSVVCVILNTLFENEKRVLSVLPT